MVHLSLLADVDAAGHAALDCEAARLTDWLAGTVIGNVYASPLMKQARLPQQPWLL